MFVFVSRVVPIDGGCGPVLLLNWSRFLFASPMFSYLRFTICGLMLRVFRATLAGPAPILWVPACWCENLFSKNWFLPGMLSFCPFPLIVLMLLGFKMAFPAGCAFGVYYSYLWVGIVLNDGSRFSLIVTYFVSFSNNSRMSPILRVFLAAPKDSSGLNEP